MKQKSRLASTQFEFGDTHLGYSLDGARKRWRFRIDYMALPKRTPLAMSTSAWFRRLGSLACAIGVIQAGWAAWNDASMVVGASLCAAGLVSILMHVVTRRHFTVLKTDAGEVWILCDRRHDQILSELRARRRARVLWVHAGWIIPRAFPKSVSSSTRRA